MQQITQSEAAYLRKHLPSAYIVVMSKKKKSRAKRYAVESTEQVGKLLEKYRESLKITEYR